MKKEQIKIFFNRYLSQAWAPSPLCICPITSHTLAAPGTWLGHVQCSVALGIGLDLLPAHPWSQEPLGCIWGMKYCLQGHWILNKLSEVLASALGSKWTQHPDVLTLWASGMDPVGRTAEGRPAATAEAARVHFPPRGPVPGDAAPQGTACDLGKLPGPVLGSLRFCPQTQAEKREDREEWNVKIGNKGMFWRGLCTPES